MTEERRVAEFTSIEGAAEHGVDADHVILHLVEAVLCAYDGDPSGLDIGFFLQFKDGAGRDWTFSVIPPDGGAISDALLDIAKEA